MKVSLTTVTHHSLRVAIFAVNFMDPDNMVAEIECLKPSLLTQQSNKDTASPLQSLSTPFPVREREGEGGTERKRKRAREKTEVQGRESFKMPLQPIIYLSNAKTHSTVICPGEGGVAYANCIALQSRWNSWHSSMLMTPLTG